MDYALTGKDYGRAADLIAIYWGPLTAQGQIETVWSWLTALPEDAVKGSAPLSVAYCWVLWLRAQVGLIEEHLVDAERAVSERALTEGHGADATLYSGLPAQVAALRAFVSRYHDEHEAACAHAERALTLVPGNLPPDANAQLHALLYTALASAYDGVGDLERAIGAYGETIRWSRLCANATGVTGMTYRLVGLLRLLGRLRAADQACRDALRYVQDQGMARLPAAGILHLALSEVLVERNDLEAAETHLAEAIELGRWSGRLDAAKNSARVLVRLRLARQDARGALAAVEAAVAAHSAPAPPLAMAEFLALRATILVRQGALSHAAACAEEAMSLAGGERGQAGEIVALAAARVHCWRTEPDEAITHLTQCLATAEESGRWGTALELRILRSLARWRQGARLEAQADLQCALAIAEPEGYVRIFVDEGEPMAALLKELKERRERRGKRELKETNELRELEDKGAPSCAYISRLLAALGTSEAPSRASAVSSPSSVSTLIEPLSQRELEVLGLMAEGLTNKEIAARLIIALGTVKAHIHNISGKLGAQNRAHAVARARDLGLL